MMKFIASNLDAAKAKAIRALGDKAVIVSVRNLPSGDVEVQASDKPQPAAPAERATEPAFGAAARQQIDEQLTRQSTGARLNESLEHRFAEDALSKLRGQLTGAKSGPPRIDMSDKTAAGFADALRPHGIGEELLAALVAGANEARMPDDLHRMETAFAVAFAYTPLAFSPSLPIMLVGPTGAGKTSCAAKLSAAAMAEGGSAFIMTADAGRAGAVEQIQTYSDTLGVDYFIVDLPQDVEAALRMKKPQGAVILDTPGISPFDFGRPRGAEEFSRGLGRRGAVGAARERRRRRVQGMGARLRRFRRAARHHHEVRCDQARRRSADRRARGRHVARPFLGKPLHLRGSAFGEPGISRAPSPRQPARPAGIARQSI